MSTLTATMLGMRNEQSKEEKKEKEEEKKDE